MGWEKVGNWLKDNAGSGAALVGSLLTGNAPGAIAAGVAMVSSATGTNDAAKALEALQTSPETMLKLRELAQKEEESIRNHIRASEEMRLKDGQETHKTTASIITSGDNATDEYVRRTRPKLARQSFYVAFAYALSMELLKAYGKGAGADAMILGLFLTPGWAYMGVRCVDKLGDFLGRKK